jgi:hypothetical protein
MWKKIRISKRTFYLRNYYYERILEDYKDFFEYFRILKLIKKNNIIYKTNTNITLVDGYDFKKIGKNQIVKKYNKPRFIYVIDKQNIKIDIFFYKIYIGGYRTRLEIHLHKNNLFYYNYTFADSLSSSQKLDIIKILCEKYLSGQLIHISNHIIFDNNETNIYVEDTLELKIHYLNTNNHLVKYLNVAKNDQIIDKKIKMEKMREELYNEL